MSYKPLIVVCLDAADANLLLEWESQGLLPALSAVMRSGNWGKIGGNEYATPHGLWLSLFSGLRKADHGYYYFHQLIPGTYSIQAYDLKSSGAVPFWAAAGSAGARVAVLDVPESFLIDDLSGCQLADFRIHNVMKAPSASPASFLKKAIDLSGKQQAVPERLNSTMAQDRKIYQQLVQRIRGIGKLSLEILKQEKPDCTVIGFSEPHIGGHQFWKYRNEDSDMRDAIRNLYQEIDLQLDRILQLKGAEANIFVVSNTGIQDQTPTSGLMRSFCESLGYQVRNGNAQNSVKVLGLLQKLIPQKFQAYTMYKLSLPLRQRLLTELHPIHSDWSRTTAFSLSSSYTGMIRINLKDREPFGIVEPGSQYRQLLNQIETDLQQLIDPITGERAVDEVFCPAKIYENCPPPVLPDLFVKWKSSAHFKEKLHHPRATISQKRPQFYRANNHTGYGFFAASGPSLQKQTLAPDRSITTFAADFLGSLGV